MEVHLDDLSAYFSNTEDEELVANILGNSLRYLDVFASAVESVLPAPTIDAIEPDVHEVLALQRAESIAAAHEGNDPDAAVSAALPPALRRGWEVQLIAPSTMKSAPLRGLRAVHIGHLVSVKGIVTRVSDVKPLVAVATYTCDQCGFEIYQEVSANSFMPIADCPSEQCKINKVSGRLYLQTRGSRFVKYQELRLQELPEQVPVGHIPRALNVHIRGELTRSAAPGDVISVAGIFLPQPATGFRGMRSGLTAETYLEAQGVFQHKKRYDDYEIDEATAAAVDAFSAQSDVYSKLSRSIAPEIFGLDDVKKALLLLLVGGVTRNLTDGMRIRGDLNVILVGDPGLAKSQLLKYVASLAPRAVYTTGKGSSGVGLTAAVMRDSVTQELTLEAGALVLADMGVACIDEFDKLDDTDRTAIHEIMEQQTVSIAKAGITTTLNARTSILAAANPSYGRYNTRRSPAENINLPPALLSRFDLLFLLLDRPDAVNDMALARHVTHVHREGTHPPLDFEPLTPHVMRAYIAQARTLNPVVPPDLTEFISGSYVAMRAEEAADDAPTGYTTARTLLAILRLSQALARLRMAPVVSQGDVQEAMRLMLASKASLYGAEEEAGANGPDPASKVYNIVRSLTAVGGGKAVLEVPMTDVENRVLAAGLTRADLYAALRTYESHNVWMVSKDRSKIKFVQ